MVAGMGLRALIEMIIVANIEDQGTFPKNLNAFYEAGYISLIQRDTLDDILEAGHGSVHRKHVMTDEELNTCLDIVEGVMASIYIHKKKTEKMRARVPERRKPAKKG
jgi:hypothetical protein